MDGTLLDSQDRISSENIAALKELQGLGIEVMIATGRLDLMVTRYLKQLGLGGYMISCNGGLIRSLDTGEIAHCANMDKSIVRDILIYCLAKNVDFLIYTPDMVYANIQNPKAAKYEKINLELEHELRLPIQYLTEANVDYIDNIIKILLVCDNNMQVAQHEENFSTLKDLTIVSSADGLLDIMAHNISKGKALQVLAGKLGVDLLQAIAFGDNYNDMDLLQCVGTPIAMGNAVEPLKKIAKYVTKSNNESGIAYAVKQYLLNNDSSV